MEIFVWILIGAGAILILGLLYRIVSTCRTYKIEKGNYALRPRAWCQFLKIICGRGGKVEGNVHAPGWEGTCHVARERTFQTSAPPDLSSEQRQPYVVDFPSQGDMMHRRHEEQQARFDRERDYSANLHRDATQRHEEWQARFDREREYSDRIHRSNMDNQAFHYNLNNFTY